MTDNRRPFYGDDRWMGKTFYFNRDIWELQPVERGKVSKNRVRREKVRILGGYVGYERNIPAHFVIRNRRDGEYHPDTNLY